LISSPKGQVFSPFHFHSALSRYLWEIDVTVASVVVGVTSFGVTCYAFFVVAGTISINCPYQAPGAHTIRRILSLALRALSSVSSHSYTIKWVIEWWGTVTNKLDLSFGYIAVLFVMTLISPIYLLVCPAIDIYLLGRAMVRTFVANAPGWFRLARGWDPQTATLDSRCISWIVQTSLDKTIHLLTLRLLATMTTLVSFDPALISACFDILAGCVSIVSGKGVILRGSEELAELSTLCFLGMLSHLTTVDPASSVFDGVRRRYTKVFPIGTDFGGLPSHHRFCIIHNTFHPSKKSVKRQASHWYTHRPKIQWRDYKLSGPEHAVLVQLARFEYQRNQRRKVPRWILRYGHHLFSLDPLPPVSVVADCLSITAMDLGRTVSNAASLNERCDNV